MQITLVMVFSIFAINVFLNKPILDSFLFSLALAVGLTPQLLPAIISINLAHGAKKMAQSKVIVKRLSSIENFGSMNILCSDKTGTLTQAVVQMRSAVDIRGNEGKTVRLYAGLNSYYQSGFSNPIDEAIRKEVHFDPSEFEKLDEIPYDFIRKRLSILLRTKDGRHLMITKGAFTGVAGICSTEENSDGELSSYVSIQAQAEQKSSELGQQGFRVLGVAYKDMGAETKISRDSEKDMILLGFLVLFDPPKPNLPRTIKELKDLGVSLKVITGDNRFVAAAVMRQVGFPNPRVLTGTELRLISSEGLVNRVNETDVFAEIEPNQKE
jgi:Mg2+-importing ATPase